MKITEKELSKAVMPFNNKNVILRYEGTINGIIKISNLKIKYKYKNGFLYIDDDNNTIHFEINGVPTYYIDVTDKSLLIKLDNYIDIYIEII